MIHLVRLGASMMLAASAAAAFAADEPAPAPQAGPAAAEKPICKMQNVVGSLVTRRRVCGTKQFWDDQQRQARHMAESGLDGCRARAEPAEGAC